MYAAGIDATDEKVGELPKIQLTTEGNWPATDASSWLRHPYAALPHVALYTRSGEGGNYDEPYLESVIQSRDIARLDWNPIFPKLSHLRAIGLIHGRSLVIPWSYLQKAVLVHDMGVTAACPNPHYLAAGPKDHPNQLMAHEGSSYSRYYHLADVVDHRTHVWKPFSVTEVMPETEPKYQLTNPTFHRDVKMARTRELELRASHVGRHQRHHREKRVYYWSLRNEYSFVEANDFCTSTCELLDQLKQDGVYMNAMEWRGILAQLRDVKTEGETDEKDDRRKRYLTRVLNRHHPSPSSVRQEAQTAYSESQLTRAFRDWRMWLMEIYGQSLECIFSMPVSDSPELEEKAHANVLSAFLQNRLLSTCNSIYRPRESVARSLSLSLFDVDLLRIWRRQQKWESIIAPMLLVIHARMQALETDEDQLQLVGPWTLAYACLFDDGILYSATLMVFEREIRLTWELSKGRYQRHTVHWYNLPMNPQVVLDYLRQPIGWSYEQTRDECGHWDETHCRLYEQSHST